MLCQVGFTVTLYYKIPSAVDVFSISLQPLLGEGRGPSFEQTYFPFPQCFFPFDKSWKLMSVGKKSHKYRIRSFFCY